MKCIFAAITLACAFAASDTTPPVISLNLAGNYDTHSNYFQGTTAAQAHAASAAHSNSFARRCEVGVATVSTCPSPDATAFDHHEGDLTTKITYAAEQFVTSAPGMRPVKTTRTAAMANNKLANSEYSNRGEFVLTYDVSDASGNKADSLVFAMIMVDTVAPTIVPTNVYTNGKAEACNDARNTNAANRCLGTGFTPTASDNYDTTLSAFTYQVDGGAAKNVAGATITIDLATLGAKTVKFTATDFADIFGSGNQDNTQTATVTIDVVDTTAPRILVRPFGNSPHKAACDLTKPIAGVVNRGECRRYTLANNVPGLYDNVCAGCLSGVCYGPGSATCASINYGATAVAETFECARANGGGVYHPTTGAPQNTGAWCVDDRLSAKTDNTNDFTTIKPTYNADAVDVLTTGTYTTTYTCSDGTLTAQATRTVTVVDTTDPVVTLVGNRVVENSAGSHTVGGTTNPFENSNSGLFDHASAKAAFTCTDTCDKSGLTITTTLHAGACTSDKHAPHDPIGGAANEWTFPEFVAGSYSILYTCEDKSGNKDTQCRTIENVDHTHPIIQILGKDVQTIEASSTANYVDAGATCEDQVDGNISDNIEVSGDVVNLARVGQYEITYNCKDSANNAAPSISRHIIVADTTCPTCVFKAGRTQHQHLTLEASFPYTDLYEQDVLCSDELQPSMTPTVSTKNAAGAAVAANAITSTVGTYYTQYTVVDGVGNTNAGAHGCTGAQLASAYTRTIVVEDSLKPVIKLHLGGSIIKAGSADSFPTGADAEYQKAATNFPSPDTGAHTTTSHTWKLMAEAAAAAPLNGWVLGAAASAVSALALLGYSLRKQAQPVATSVPV